MTDIEFYLEDLKSRFKGIDGNKYYLSYSGGKDSHFLYWFIKEYLKDDKIQIVAINTYMEHPQIRERMYRYSDKVLLPRMKPFEIKEKYGSPCFSKIQDDFIDRYQKGCRSDSLMNRVNGSTFIGRDGKEYRSSFNLNKKARELLLSGRLHKVSSKCCQKLKKETARRYGKEAHRKPILGVRASEGHLRKTHYTTCFSKDGTFTPIHDLSDEMLDRIYAQFGIEIPEIYNYITRTGCVGCPYGSRGGKTEKELSLVSRNQRKFICEYFKESYEVLGIKTDELNE